MSETREIIIVKQLQPELLNDYLTFFDYDAFTDNPDWASCYCHFHLAQHDLKPWPDRTAGENRAAVGKMIEGGQMSGYLAFLGGRVVGWCNAAPRARFTTLAAAPDAERTGAIICFVVAKKYRRQGVATLLLSAACAGLKRQGMSAVEAYPRRGADSDASHYHGPLRMFLDAGFEIAGEKDGVITVRKSL